MEAESTVLHARANAEGRRLEAQAEAYAEKQRADAQLVSKSRPQPANSQPLCTPWLSSAAGIREGCLLKSIIYLVTVCWISSVSLAS